MTITRNVCDINAADRRALENVLGEALGEDQQIVISVQRTSAAGSFPAHPSSDRESQDVLSRVLQITSELFGSGVHVWEDYDPESPGDKYVVFSVGAPDAESAVRLEREWLRKVRSFQPVAKLPAVA